MPYSRRMSRSSRGVKRPYKRGRSSYSAASKSFGKQLTRVKNRAIANLRTGGLVGIETKFLDLARSQPEVPNVRSLAGLPGATTAAAGMQPLGLPGYAPGDWTAAQALCACLSAPCIGNDANSRDGRQIRAVDITIAGTVHQGYAQYADNVRARPPIVYIALVMDLQTNASANPISASDVFVCPAAKNMVTETSSYMAGAAVFRNIENLPRYRVLAYKTVTLDTDTFVQADNIFGGMASKPFRLSRRLQFPIQFLKDSKDVAGGGYQRSSVSDKSICLLAWTTHTQSTAVDGLVGVTYNSRFRWVG